MTPLGRQGAGLTMRWTRFRPVIIVVATISITGLMIYGVLLAAARGGDERQVQIEETIVRSAVDRLASQLSSGLHQNSYWSQAYDQVDATYDAVWVRHQLVPDAVWSNTQVTLIADAADRPIYYFDRAPRARIAPTPLGRELTALLDRARAAPHNPPVPETGFVKMDGHIYLAAAQAIAPDDARSTKPLQKHFVLAYLAPLDRAELLSLQRGFPIAPIDVSPMPVAGLAQVALLCAHGKTVAWLNWRPAQPGQAFANHVAPIAFAAFVLMGALQLHGLKSWSRASQRMRDEGVARTMFLANVSHELRTPLNAIIGFSECMTGELFGPLSGRYREYANDILMSGKYLLGIVDDVLDLTQLNSTDAIPLEPLKLCDAVERPLRMLREYSKSDAIGIEFADRSAGALVMANQKAVSQLLLNLGSNAVKFSPCGATVSVVLQPSPVAHAVELVVRDSGSGFPADKLRLIGQPFLQAHNATARKPGSGLGLAIVKTLAERLNGELLIQSMPGQGTTAVVRLPMLEQRESAHALAAATA